ncbi:MAG: spore germination protein [Clostridia bacterium]|nr:spore germination protein [Clostridia bacterium]
MSILEKNEFERLYGNLLCEFSGMSDFCVRELAFGGENFFILYIIGHGSKDLINRFVIEPLSAAYLRGGSGFPLGDIITGGGFSFAVDFEAAKNAVLEGNALIVFPDMPPNVFGYICAVKNDEGRANTEPETENVVRGPHDGFNESAAGNAVLLRRRIKSERLKSEKLTLGTLTKTEVILMYISDLVNREALAILKRRLADIKADALIDSGSVEMYIQDGRHALYPTVGNSERPDKVAAKILEGRIAVIVDGSPVVLTVPYLFCEGFQVSEDYAKSPFFATFVRSLRFAAVMLGIFLPGLFLALVEHHMDFLPREMAEFMAETRKDMTVSLTWEIITAFLIFEILREVGLRMPKAVGSAVGVVGSLILGESAVSAGIISPFVLIIVAFSAVCNFICAPYMNPNAVFRLALILAGGFFGLFGFFAAVAASLLLGAGKSSFGVPYFSPFAPLSAEGLRDFLYMSPIWRMKKVPPAVSGKDAVRTEGKA